MVPIGFDHRAFERLAIDMGSSIGRFGQDETHPHK